MVFIKLYGADQVIGMQVSDQIESYLRKRVEIPDPISFICTESFLVHGGQEQTSFRVLCEVVAPSDLQGQREDIARVLSEALRNLSVHSHIIFTWFDRSDEFEFIDHDYPDYLTPDNMVRIASDGEEEGDEDDEGGSEDGCIAAGKEPYFGNVFQDLDDFVKAHPEMSEDEATLAFYDTLKKKTPEENK